MFTTIFYFFIYTIYFSISLFWSFIKKIKMSTWEGLFMNSQPFFFIFPISSFHAEASFLGNDSHSCVNLSLWQEIVLT